jgi:hypothetical protein
MKRLALLAAAGAFLVPAPAGAVNDPFTPADNCAPDNAEAVGHPSLTNNQTPATAANPPFSLNNPGQSTGAKGAANSQADC